jgi:hypothetical protein
MTASPTSPSYLSEPTTPAIVIIRETMYAALADVIEKSESIRGMMKTDPFRAYFAAVAFGILEVATKATTADGKIRGVMGKELSVETAPEELKPFTREFLEIGKAVRKCEAEDNEEAIAIASRGGKVPAEMRMERTKKVLEKGIGYNRRGQNDDNRMSVGGRAVTLANRVNALALGMTRLKAFRDRQDEVFKVLGGLGPT